MAKRQDRRTYDFKSVGELADNRIAEAYKAQNIPIGIKTPLELGSRNNIYKMHTSMEAVIADNLRNLILTNRGERLARYDFGANLIELVTEMGSESGDQEAMMRIKAAVAKYLPFVSLAEFATEVDHFDNKEVAKVDLILTYRIPRISNKLKGLKVTLYNAG